MTLFPKFRLANVRSPRLASRIAPVSDNWLAKPDVVVFSDGRERCNPRTPGGSDEYKFRRFLLWLRQYSPRANEHLCCNCRAALEFGDITFEHEALRGKDMDERLYDSHGRPINGASHYYCNRKRGSQRLPIWHGTLDVRDVRLTAEQFAHVVGKKCFCSRRKSELASCCQDCMVKLSPQLQRDLYRLTEINAFADALESAANFLKEETNGSR